MGVQIQQPWTPELRTARWTTGFNMPGYMPNPDDVAVHATWQEARASLDETIASHMDHDGIDSRLDAVWNAQVEAREYLRHVKEDRPAGVQAGQFVYWLEPVLESPPRVLRVPGKIGEAIEWCIKLDVWLGNKPTDFFLRDGVYDEAIEVQSEKLAQALDETRMDDDPVVQEFAKFLAEDSPWYFEVIDDPMDAHDGVMAFINDTTGETVHVVGLNHATAYGA